jgi:hypothetical protein
MGFRGSTQDLAGMGMERIKEDLLNVAFDILVPIHAAASLSGAGMDPVCGAIAGAGKTFRVDKGFEQQRFDAIGVKPIVRKLMDHKREDFAGKLRDLDPGKDEKSAVVDDAWQVALASLIVPSDPAVSRSNLQGGTCEKQAGDNPV